MFEPDLADDLVRRAVRRQVPVAWYFMRTRNDSRITEFCVANARDPHQEVKTKAPDGRMQRWAKRWEGDLLVFTPPDGYVEGPLQWRYDKRLQIGQEADRKVQEREALRGRVSA
jgi:hypothetical protein